MLGYKIWDYFKLNTGITKFYHVHCNGIPVSLCCTTLSSFTSYMNTETGMSLPQLSILTTWQSSGFRLNQTDWNHNLLMKLYSGVPVCLTLSRVVLSHMYHNSLRYMIGRLSESDMFAHEEKLCLILVWGGGSCVERAKGLK